MRVRVRARGLGVVIGCVVLCLAVPAFGQSSGGTVGVDLIGADPSDGVFNNAYAGVYDATASGFSSGNVICDDWNDEVYAGETWKATSYQASTLTSTTNTYFMGSIGLAGYAELATLVSMEFNKSPAYTNVELNTAIWAITGGLSVSSLDAKAQALVASVIAYVNGQSSLTGYLAQFSNLWILTPVKGSQNPLADGNPQEFWIADGSLPNINVPEGGAALLYLLLAGFSCFGAMFIRSRIQLRNRETA